MGFFTLNPESAIATSGIDKAPAPYSLSPIINYILIGIAVLIVLWVISMLIRLAKAWVLGKYSARNMHNRGAFK
jgi:hypothetical protein